MRRSTPELSAFLVIDQATVSGVAAAGYDQGRMHTLYSGTANKAEHRLASVWRALQLAGCRCIVLRLDIPGYPIPCTCGAAKRIAVLFEDHGGIPAGKGIGTPQLLGMGAARGRWEETLAYVGHPEKMRFKVAMHVWRGAILGKSFSRAKKEIVKPEAVRWAEARTGRRDVSDDEAEALCMLHWAVDNIPQSISGVQRGLGF